MKTLYLSALSAVLALGLATATHAQTVVTTTTAAPAPVGAAVTADGSIVTSSGVVDTFAPGNHVIVREQTGPVTYIHNPNSAYVFKGVRLTPEQAQARIRAGLPVKVEYMNQGNTRVIQRVVLADDDDEVDDDDDLDDDADDD